MGMCTYAVCVYALCNLCVHVCIIMYDVCAYAITYSNVLLNLICLWG